MNTATQITLPAASIGGYYGRTLDDLDDDALGARFMAHQDAIDRLKRELAVEIARRDLVSTRRRDVAWTRLQARFPAAG